MYQKFFGINKKPFSIAPDPSFMYMSKGHREALAHLRYGLENDGGFVLLTGEVGAGKTTVCRCLLEHVPDDANVAFILNPKLSPLELLAAVCDELAITISAAASAKGLIDAINDYLLIAHSQGRHTVLIIDEAQNLSVEVLEQVRLLTNLETNEQKLLQIIMLGQPELQEKLASKELKQLAQRISARYHLGPLDVVETVAYVRHRLSVAGMSPLVFSRSSFKKLFSLSGGIPRLINIICDRALLGAYVKGVQRVDSNILAVAGGEVFGGKLQSKSLRYVSPWLIAALTILVCGTILAVLNWSPIDSESVKKVRDISVVQGTVPVRKVVKEMPLVNKPHVLHWPVGQQAEASENIAMQTILHIWGLNEFSPANEWGCRYAEDNGLHCLADQAGLAGVLRLNRPAIFRMRNEEQQEFFMVLTADRGTQLEFRLGKEVVVAVPADLALRWTGSYIVLWKPPPGYRESIRPGHRGREVTWLAEQLALVAGEEYNQHASVDVFGSAMVQKIKRLQFTNNLIPDGIVGKETVILLNTLTDSGLPLLRRVGE